MKLTRKQAEESLARYIDSLPIGDREDPYEVLLALYVKACFIEIIKEEESKGDPK